MRFLDEYFEIDCFQLITRNVMFNYSSYEFIRVVESLCPVLGNLVLLK